MAAVRAMQANGVRSIDVGCGQINLMYHPDAFPNLELAFDPQANAAYAARFLKALSRADRRLEEGDGDVSLGDAGARRRVPAAGAGGLAGGAAGRRPGGSDATGAGLGRHDRHAPARLFACAARAAAGDGSRTADHHAAYVGGEAPPGRGLDAYRAAPIGLAYQPPPSRRAGG